MDGVRRRRCETCVFHEPGPTACTGRCRNPEWQPRGGAPLFVRDRETACYQGWGRDHWRAKGPNDGPGGSNGPNPGGAGGGGQSAHFSSPVGASGPPSIPVELLAADLVVETAAMPLRPATND